MTRLKILLALIALMSFQVLALCAGKKTDAPVPFETATVRFEQNATDGDVEVVFEAKGGDQGLAKLTVVAPDGRTVVDFTAPDAVPDGFLLPGKEYKIAIGTVTEEGNASFVETTFTTTGKGE